MKKTVGYVTAILVFLVLMIGMIIVGKQRQDVQLTQQMAHYSQQSQSVTKTQATTEKQLPNLGSDNAKWHQIGAGKQLKVAVMGDEIAAGYYAGTPKQAFQYQVTNFLHKSLGYQVSLKGHWRKGATIGGAAIDNYQRLVNWNPDLLILEYGTNDQDPKNSAYASPKTFWTNLQALLTDLQAKLPQTKVILLTSWQGKNNQTYDPLIKSAGRQAGIDVLDLAPIWHDQVNRADSSSQTWTKTVTKKWPNTAGQVEIARSLIQKELVPFYVPRQLR
ncbi:SGNH/GDSL hydrolase family protein [Lactobacillus sp. DCY120]|uniref:SGNH/GDSL hydrolase family protein n=1 Tax=Bombilactobacillus apium TaxID=2675299 RepID=A0A850QZU6_9LACO|nr:SGNH/GDSL hydrolase family protein [Bombilactobacillus apium]NVY96213.1 SGNH/GDSL hydrolase family protein [Bombilactobacillus apium]